MDNTILSKEESQTELQKIDQMTDQTKMDLWRARNQKVYRSNDIVQRSRYHLTRQENCILQFMMSKIKPDDDYNTVYEAPVDELLYMLRYKSDSYSKLRKTIQSMADKSFWVINKNPKEDDVLVRWISVSRINRGSRTIKFSFHPEIAPYLFDLVNQNPGKFDGYKLSYMISLSTYYAQRLYDTLISYSNNNSYFFELGTGDKEHDLFIILCSDPTHNGVVPKTWHSDFGNFKSKILDPSIEEINEYTDLKVEYELKKQDRFGNRYRKYRMIIFYFRRRNEKELVRIDKKIDDDYKELDQEYQRLITPGTQMSIFDLNENEKMKSVMEEEVYEEDTPEKPIVQPEETKPVVDELVASTDGEVVYATSVLLRYTKTVEEFERRKTDLTESEKALLVLEAERHIGINVDRTYEDSWICRYIMFYLDPILFQPTKTTNTTLFNRLLDCLVKDYKKYASIIDEHFKKRESNPMRDIISGNKRSTYNNYDQRDYDYEELEKKIIDN